MNKPFTIILSILGGVYALFSTVLPIIIIFLMIKVYNFTGFNYYLLLTLGFLSSFYRAIDIFGIETFEYLAEVISKRRKNE